jgi:AraC family transcriptional regulator of arabinose operon
LRYKGGEQIVSRGEVVLFAPGTLHDYGTAGLGRKPHWELLWVHFELQARWAEWVGGPELSPGLYHFRTASGDERSALVRRFKDMIRWNAHGRPWADAFALNALEEVLLWCYSLNPRRGVWDVRVKKAVDYMNRLYAQRVRWPQVARQAGLSESRLAHLFRAQVGLTPHDYLETVRLNRARQLLEVTQDTVAQVAEQTGFESPFYFSLRFKRHFGQGPRAFRQELLGRS